MEIEARVNFLNLRGDQRPDVLQFFSSPARSVPYLWLARLLGFPSVRVCTMVKGGRAEARGPVQRLRDRIAVRMSLQPFDCVITSSTVMSQRLIEAGASPKEIRSFQTV